MKKIKKNTKKLKKIIVIFILMLAINFCSSSSVLAEEQIIGDEILYTKFSDITAPNIYVTETNSGNVLYGKNSDEVIYPASLTKLMTAILVVENCELDEIVTVSETAVNSVPSGYVNSNLQVGEELMVKDLLYVMLIPSANDAANALAEYVGGSIESFATMMNSKAKDLGCTNTNFTNPSGLHSADHVSSARDIGIIANEAIKSEILKEIMGTTTYTLPETNKYKKSDRIFTTTNYMKLKNMTKFYYEECVAAKTGYTEYAKNCVVEFGEKDGIEITAVIMGEVSKVKGQKFLDAKEIFDTIFENYKIKEIVKKDEVIETIEIKNATKETRQLELIAKEDIKILVQKEDNKEITREINQYLYVAPIKSGNVVGEVIYEYNGNKFSTELIAKEDVEMKEINIPIIIGLIMILFILYKLKKSKKKNGNHGKKIKKT